MTIQRPSCMTTLRQGSVSISLFPAARSCAGPRPASGVSGAGRIPLPVTKRAPWPIAESDRCAAEYERLRAIPTVLVAARRSSSSFLRPLRGGRPIDIRKGVCEEPTGAPPDMTACLALIPGLGRAPGRMRYPAPDAKCSAGSRARPAQLHALPGKSGLNIAGGCCGSAASLRLLTAVVRDGVVCRTQGGISWLRAVVRSQERGEAER
jgi:hypothetical protein